MSRLLLLLSATAALAAPPFDPGEPIKAANGTELRLFAKEPFLRNTVAVCVDEQGRVYATSVVRRKAADLDIRQFRDWITKDLELSTIEEKRAWLKSELTPENAARYKKIGDQNKDGTIDWKDLTVLTDRIIMVEDTNADGLADRATTFAKGFNTEITGIAAGITAWDNTIYATVEPDLLKLKDTNGDRIADARESLANGFSVRLAYAGHNFSGPIIGPDGRVYASAPDKGLHLTTKEGKVLANPLSGAIVRCELDGSNLELFATGLRNVQQPAFDQFGNLFGVDNDGDMKGEKERFVYITEGSDHGWRNNWQYRGKDWCPWMNEGLSIPAHSDQPAYITPPLQSYKDGPAGLAFNPGTAINDFYTDHFFMSSFPSGRLFAFKAEQDGAAFKMTGEHQVASGFLMVGLGFGPEGALYIADWSAKGYELNEQGGVWKLDDPSQSTSEYREHINHLIAADWSKPSVEKVAKHLASPDQRVRMKAQFELVRRKEIKSLQTIYLNQGQPLLARLHALWGLGQLGRTGTTLEAAAFLAGLKDSDPELRAQTAKVLSEFQAPAVATALIKLLADPEDRPRFFAAIALGKLKTPAVYEALAIYASTHGTDPYHRHAAIVGLVGCATSTQLAALSTHESRPLRLAAVVALRRQRAPEITAFLSDPDPLLVAEAASAIHDDTSIPAARDALAQLLDSPTHHERTLRRALSAALRLRSPEQAARVAKFATSNTTPKHLRLVALNILNTWPNPPVLDTVEGRHRPLPKISASTIASAVTESLTSLLDDSHADIAKAARAAASTYGIGTDPAELLAIVEADNPETAPDALRLLATHPAKQKEAAKLALESTHEIIRAEALRALASTDPEKFITIASAFLADENILESRAVFEGLGNLNHPDAGKILITALPAIRSMEIPAELRLDALEAARASKVPAVIKALAEYNATPTKDDLIAYTGTLYGGNPVNGEDLFNNHIAAQCIRCHSTDAGGSTVGPNLGKIGAKDPRFLLESLVLPSKAIAPGYGLLSITLKDGDSLAGTLMEQTPHALTIRLADQSTRKISRADIATQTPPVSSMPPMNLLLTKKELRDVLAYLQSLK